ncbi:MAG: DUF177 domain-containing protein [Oscillospiraceae bacterium]|nr:DUF177 domain-containing protein [Oscillospiraceae bacterium]
MSYTINIESVIKKEASATIDIDYEIVGEEELNEYRAVLRAEKINVINIDGCIYQKNGMPFVEYEITAEFIAECARCNKETPHTITVRGEKYIAGVSEDKEESDDYYVTETEGIINISDFIREFLSLEVPLRYLCSEECKGLCPKCGKDLNDGDCSCPKKEKNPAFAVLDDFFK